MNNTIGNVIETTGLTKKYGSITAVNNLNISIKEGEVFGILGPNGSGKTTTLGMLAGVTNSTSGSFTWFGQEANAASRRKLGIILERPNFYPDQPFSISILKPSIIRFRSVACSLSASRTTSLAF